MRGSFVPSALLPDPGRAYKPSSLLLTLTDIHRNPSSQTTNLSILRADHQSIIQVSQINQDDG